MPTIVIMVLTLTAGTGVVMWMGELLTDRGIGNGMSVLIFTSIASGFHRLAVGHPAEGRPLGRLIGIILLGFVMALVIFVEQSQRRVPVQYAKRQVGRRMYGGKLDLHPAQGQHGGRHPGHLRQRCCRCRRSSPSSTGHGQPTGPAWCSGSTTT